MMETTSLSKTTTEIERISSLETCGLSTRTQDDTTLICIVLIGKCNQWFMVHGPWSKLASRQSTLSTLNTLDSQHTSPIPLDPLNPLNPLNPTITHPHDSMQLQQAL